MTTGLTSVAWTAPAAKGPPTPPPPAAATVRFAVLSDLHFYDNRLGTAGAAFEQYLFTDLKLLPLSEAILDAAIADLLQRDLRFVLVSGDLTKDGEVLNHTRVTQALHRLDRAGIQVLVVPGNHDIDNPDAVTYLGDTTRPVPSVNAAAFRAMYRKYGYNRALAHAPDSLSYVAEPVPGLWLLALDSVRWAENDAAGTPLIGGRLTAATRTWALAQLQQAQTGGKRVIAFMHHGLVPHYLAQPSLFPDYLIEDFGPLAFQLWQAGLKVIFTGHYHSHDAAWMMNGAGEPLVGTLCDIETSSLVSFPCAYRLAELKANGVLTVQTRQLQEIGVPLPQPLPQYADTFARGLLPFHVAYMLWVKFGVVLEPTSATVGWVVDALMAHYAGDEAPTPATQALLSALMGFPAGTMENYLGQVLTTLWFDTSPGDNTLTLSLAP